MNPEGRFAIQYGVLEETLSTLFELPRDRVRSRFRKLRLAGFPDDIQTGSGLRVVYDLPRVVAISAVFALADGMASQNEAVRIVSATWPEWCRATIVAAAGERGTGAGPSCADDYTSVIWIAPDGLAIRPRSLIVASTAKEMAASLPTMGWLVVDVAPILGAFASLPEAQESIALSVEDLKASFGWSYTRQEMPWRVQDKPPQGGFLRDGPYFERAAAFLDVIELQPLSPALRMRLRLMRDYFWNLPQLDRWKGEIRYGPTSPGLNEMLLILSGKAGVSPRYPLAIEAAAWHDGDAVTVARKLIAAAQRLRGTGGQVPSSDQAGS